MAGTVHHPGHNTDHGAGRRGQGPRSRTQPVRITTAAISPSADVAHRQRRYVLTMTIRLACFIGAVVTDGWVRWVLVVGALVLPYIAVVMANSASPRVDEAPLLHDPPNHHEIE